MLTDVCINNLINKKVAKINRRILHNELLINQSKKKLNYDYISNVESKSSEHNFFVKKYSGFRK
jgi:hypothetical protein